MLKNLFALLISIALSAIAFAQTADTPDPMLANVKVMVMPFTKDGEDIRTKLGADISLRDLITRIGAAFEKRGYNVLDFEATLKAATDKHIFKSNTTADVKSALLTFSGADVYVETEIAVLTTSTTTTVKVLLTAYDATSAKKYASITCNSRERNNDTPVGDLLAVAINLPVPPMDLTDDDNTKRSKLPCLDDFLNALQLKRNSITSKKVTEQPIAPPPAAVLAKPDAMRGTTVAPTENTTISEGKYYALLIGVQHYKDPSIPSLDGPIGDARELGNALMQHYTFTPENVTFLNDPTRAQIFDALDNLSRKIKDNDNLLIFYAGHGNWDASRKEGYWYPADAETNRRASWLTNADLIGYINGIKAKHTLLISDACFSGSILIKQRSIETASRNVQALYNLPSRRAITSGAMKVVQDKSVFIKYLVKNLLDNTDPYLPSEELFTRFKPAVINNSSNDQVPQSGVLLDTGDEGGDFIFVKKQ